MKAKRIRKWLLGLGVLAAAGSMGCSSHQPLISADYVDLDQFMGDWYVIANIPTPPEKNAVNALEQYARKPNGDIDITFSFNKGDVTAKRKVMHAKGFVQEGSGNARWKVQFIWPLRFPYYVMEVDPEYQYTVIGLPSRKYLWIMARESSIPDSTYQSILTRVQQAGYDTSAIQMVPQEW